MEHVHDFNLSEPSSNNTVCDNCGETITNDKYYDYDGLCDECKELKRMESLCQ